MIGISTNERTGIPQHGPAEHYTFKMEGNRDDSEKCLRVAEKYLRAGDKEKALKFLNKAERLYPSKRAKGMRIIASE